MSLHWRTMAAMESEQRARDAIAQHVTQEIRRATGGHVEELSWEGPIQLALTTRYELRGVRYDLSISLRRVAPMPAPDPWAHDLRHADASRPGEEVTQQLDYLHVVCRTCPGTGSADCPNCRGTGAEAQGAAEGPCGWCDGRGHIVCPECRSSGCLLAKPTVWSRIVEHKELRSMRAKRLPVDVAAELAVSGAAGVVTHRQEAPQIAGLVARGAGYRDSFRVEEPIVEVARSLCDAPGIEPGGRILHQVLEVTRVPVAHVRFARGRELWCWGDPPRIAPADALESAWRRFWKRIGFGAAG